MQLKTNRAFKRFIAVGSTRSSWTSSLCIECQVSAWTRYVQEEDSIAAYRQDDDNRRQVTRIILSFTDVCAWWGDSCHSNMMRQSPFVHGWKQMRIVYDEHEDTRCISVFMFGIEHGLWVWIFTLCIHWKLLCEYHDRYLLAHRDQNILHWSYSGRIICVRFGG